MTHELRRARPRRLALAPVVVVIGVLATIVATASSWHAAQRAADRGVDPVSRVVAMKTAFMQARALGRTRMTLPVPIPPPLGESVVLVALVGTRGYVAALLPLERVVARLRTAAGGARSALYDGRAGLGGGLGRWSSSVRQDVDVAGRTWTVAVERPHPATGRTLAIVVIGLLLTLVLGLTSRLLVRRERRAEAGRLDGRPAVAF